MSWEGLLAWVVGLSLVGARLYYEVRRHPHD